MTRITKKSSINAAVLGGEQFWAGLPVRTEGRRVMTRSLGSALPQACDGTPSSAAGTSYCTSPGLSFLVWNVRDGNNMRCVGMPSLSSEP